MRFRKSLYPFDLIPYGFYPTSFGSSWESLTIQEKSSKRRESESLNGRESVIRDSQSLTEKTSMGKKQHGHVHALTGATTCQDEHTHMYPGVSSEPIETPKGHVHKITGKTTFNDRHVHYYKAYSSPPITLSNGYHTHYVKVETSKNDGHIHIIQGFTEPSKE